MAALRGLELEVRDEQWLGQGTISVDGLIMPPAGSGLLPIAVEVDGPYHFLVNRERQPTGTARFKHRLLDLAVERGEVGAWVSVPYWEWDGVKGGAAGKRKYLSKLLECRGVVVERYRAGKG
jgi:hypothetical protein